eukprot:m.103770 g.103770  ORF g.103770 m.103770 type:complete len:50 (+) comp27515_c0_seq4:2992-3141(+)
MYPDRSPTVCDCGCGQTIVASGGTTGWSDIDPNVKLHVTTATNPNMIAN